MSVTKKDTETETTAVVGTKSHYCYRWNGDKGKGFQCKYFCACSNCIQSKWQLCEHRDYCGNWKTFKQKAIGKRPPKGLIQFASPQKAIGDEEFIVSAIVGKRIMQVHFFHTMLLIFQ